MARTNRSEEPRKIGDRSAGDGEEMPEQSSSMVPERWRPLAAVAKRLAIWSIFFGICWILDEFISLVVVTFIVCYILNGLTELLTKRFRVRRRVVVAGIFTALAAIIAVSIIVVIPRAIDEGKSFTKELPETMKKVERSAAAFIETDLYERIQSLGVESSLQEMASSAAKKATLGVRDFFKFLFHLFLSLIFACLILLDLPKMKLGVQALKDSRLGPFYDEISPHLVKFFEILGKVFEAQVFIASVNTVITFFGLLGLGIPFAFMLSSTVFFCGFIPVLGVFISSVPIVLVGFNVGGFILSLKAIALVTGIHMLEAYVLNPQIMGEHLAIHPLIVIVVLLLGETFFGIWGLLLGVPVALYVFRDILKAVPA